MTNSKILKKAKTEVESMLQAGSSKDFVYHNPAHTISVVNYSNRFAQHFQVSKSDQEILALAAWFHDTGYTVAYREHEKHSERIARAFLKKENYPAHKIEQVAGCIQATVVTAAPNNLLEQIIKDADLANLGEESFGDHSTRLRHEWAVFLNEVYTDSEWYEVNCNFLEMHQYYTSAAQKLFGKLKKINYKKMKQIHDEQKRMDSERRSNHL